MNKQYIKILLIVFILVSLIVLGFYLICIFSDLIIEYIKNLCENHPVIEKVIMTILVIILISVVLSIPIYCGSYGSDENDKTGDFGF